MQYLADQNGQYQGSITGTAEEIVNQTPSGYTATILPPPRSSDYWNGAEWVAIGVAPSPFHKFNYAEKAWEDVRSLDEIKQLRWEAIKLQRNVIEFGGFTYLDHKFDSDQISQVRILAAVVMGQPIPWTLANDETINLTVEQVQSLGQALATHVTTTHSRGRLARMHIDQATSADEVNAVVI